METPNIAADETALQELKLGQGKAHRTTLKPLHWKEKKKKLFIFHLRQEIQSSYSSITRLATLHISKIDRASFPTRRQAK